MQLEYLVELGLGIGVDHPGKLGESYPLSSDAQRFLRPTAGPDEWKVDCLDAIDDRRGDTTEAGSQGLFYYWVERTCRHGQVCQTCDMLI